MKKMSRRRIRSRRRGLILLGTLCLWTLMLITYVILNQEIIVRSAITIFTEHLMIPDKISCYSDNIETPVNNFKNNSIFVISATCNNVLSIHDSCAIESVLRNNAKRKVYVLVTQPLTFNPDHNYLEQVVSGYQHFQYHVNIINIMEFVKDTPVKGIFSKDFFNIRARRYKRVREVLKLAALYRFGGVVIDLEMLVAQPVEVLGANGASKVSDTRLGGAILALDNETKIGKILLKTSLKILNDMRNETDLDAGLILTNAFLDLCLTEPIAECHNFQIYEPDCFYPLNSTENYKYFEQGDLIPNVYGYYIWNRYDMLPKENSLYWKLMKEYCPRVHSLINKKENGKL